jgi:hypothetical protein
LGFKIAEQIKKDLYDTWGYRKNWIKIFK